MIAGDQVKTSEPSLKGEKGDRDQRGRFRPGHRAPGPGNPYAKRVAELRKALLSAVTPEDITAIARKLIERAIAGDVVAARELLDRLVGKAPSPVLLDLQELEDRKLRLAEDRQADARWGKN